MPSYYAVSSLKNWGQIKYFFTSLTTKYRLWCLQYKTIFTFNQYHIWLNSLFTELKVSWKPTDLSALLYSYKIADNIHFDTRLRSIQPRTFPNVFKFRKTQVSSFIWKFQSTGKDIVKSPFCSVYCTCSKDYRVSILHSALY